MKGMKEKEEGMKKKEAIRKIGEKQYKEKKEWY